jgi:hypothetical protein
VKKPCVICDFRWCEFGKERGSPCYPNKDKKTIKIKPPFYKEEKRINIIFPEYGSKNHPPR